MHLQYCVPGALRCRATADEQHCRFVAVISQQEKAVHGQIDFGGRWFTAKTRQHKLVPPCTHLIGLPTVRENKKRQKDRGRRYYFSRKINEYESLKAAWLAIKKSTCDCDRPTNLSTELPYTTREEEEGKQRNKAYETEPSWANRRDPAFAKE